MSGDHGSRQSPGNEFPGSSTEVPAGLQRHNKSQNAYKTFNNSSTLTPACFRMPRRVPGASSRWTGITHPTFASMLLFITTWLPLCLTFLNPSLSKAEIRSVPDNRLTRSGMRNFKSRHKKPVRVGVRKFFQIKFRSLTQIFQSVFYSIALTDSSSFRAFGDIQI